MERTQGLIFLEDEFDINMRCEVLFVDRAEQMQIKNKFERWECNVI